MKLKDLQEISGTYDGTVAVSKTHHFPINVLQSFYIEDEKADSFTLTYPENEKVNLKYIVKNGSNLAEKTITLEGKKTKYGFEIYLKKNKLFVPFIYGNADIDKITIGKNSKGELIIHNYQGKSESLTLFGISNSNYYQDIRVFKKI